MMLNFLIFLKKSKCNCLKTQLIKFSSCHINLNNIKKERTIFEKLLHIGNYINKYVTDDTNNISDNESNNIHSGSDNEVVKSYSHNPDKLIYGSVVMNKDVLKKYSQYIENDYEELKRKVKKEINKINGECNSSDEYSKNSNKYNSYLYDCIIKNEYNDLLIADVIYENKKKILCLGEANLSFSALLQKKLPLCEIVGTSLEDKKILIQTYGNIFNKNLKKLESCGGIYIPNVDVETLDKQLASTVFDVIIFNFPFVLPTEEFIREKWKGCLDGVDNKSNNNGNNNYIKFYRKAEYYLTNKLLYHLFKCSSTLLKNNGYLHIRITDKYLTCNFKNSFNLKFLQKINFYNAYPIYESQKYIPAMYNTAITNTDIAQNNKKTKKKIIMYTSKGITYKKFKMKNTSTLVFQKS
ncbi:conserved protein, unknown function [Hepatocystis sp. ex Piliocolobus tephrosceles]|nr:conserved protein, unknown function [Hepatocystis sp. ex Piliocolobus tephrosceles]